MRGVELIVSAIYWWNPLVWVVRRQIHQAEDLCCDARVRWALPELPALRRGRAQDGGIARRVAVGARLLPASPFLHSLSLKARIEMILESRFAPCVSTRSMFAVALLARRRLAVFRSDSAQTEARAGRMTNRPRRQRASRVRQATAEFPYVRQIRAGRNPFRGWRQDHDS